MAQPQRRDGYGRPLPELADAQREVLIERPHNQEMRQFRQQQLHVKDQALLRRGTYAKVVLIYEIVDGMIQDDIATRVHEYHRHVPKER